MSGRFRRCARDYYYFPGDGFGYGYGFAVRTDPGNARPPPPGSIGELKWDSGSGTYFGVDPKLDMIYILLEQTQNERGRITPAFRKLVYDAFDSDKLISRATSSLRREYSTRAARLAVHRIAVMALQSAGRAGKTAPCVGSTARGPD
jgi:CubicO group peptidase (beta-lactamase class C family)